jgi:hypothetical protein
LKTSTAATTTRELSRTETILAPTTQTGGTTLIILK